MIPRRQFMETVAQILVNLNEGVAIHPGSTLHNELERTFPQDTRDLERVFNQAKKAIENN